MRLLFPADPFDGRAADEVWQPEVNAAGEAGMPVSLLDYEALFQDGSAARAVRHVAPGAGEEPAVLRGWMVRAEEYGRLYAALEARGLRLINTPSAYVHCHHLPASYEVIRPCTPRTVWLPVSTLPSLAEMAELLQPFGERAVVLKDYVKSRKHEWAEACFIPSAADTAAVERVVRRFLELQGADLAGGLVFREFVEFEPLGVHPQSGMPLTREYRVFFLDGVPLATAPYWEAAGYGDAAPPVEQFAEVARRVRSRFFTMDLARGVDGKWWIVELGDGQVAGLPQALDPAAFYAALRQRLGF